MRKGIDVSYHQGVIDWAKVKSSGVKVAVIRAGYRGTVDTKAKYNIEKALENGIEVGLYWFIYVDRITIEQNAQAFLYFANAYKDKIKHKLWADWEYDTEKKSPGYTPAKRSNDVRKFLEILNENGFDAGIYSNMDYIKSGKFTPQLIADYPLWFARYTNNDDPGLYAKKGKELYLWQYSSKGTVPGINGNVDMNRVFETIQIAKTYPVPSIKTKSIVTALNSIQVTSTFEYRKKIAIKNSISNYKGTDAQNTEMLRRLMGGTLLKI